MKQELVIAQLVEKAAEPVYMKRQQLRSQVISLITSIRYKEGTDEAYLRHLDKALVYYVNQFLGQVTIIGDWVSKGYIPSTNDGMAELEKLFSLCREYADKGKMFVDSINPLKSLREKQSISARLIEYEEYYFFCFIRNEIVMSLFDVITYDKYMAKKLFGLLDSKFTVQDFKQMLTEYIDSYVSRL